MNIKQFFHSSYPMGRLIEADYSQLEIRALAELSRDEQLIDDLASGVDLHALNAANWLKKPLTNVTPEERRAAKTISFQLQYGASYKGIAARSGISEADAKAFIKAYEDRYWGVTTWQRSVYEKVLENARSIFKRTPGGYFVQRSFYVCPITSRRYTFYSRDDKFKGGTSFYKPEVKNYPVQGFATGDIVPLALGRLMRRILKDNNGVKLVNTVHDSVLLDCPPFAFQDTVRMVKRVLESAPLYIEEDYGWKMRVPLPVDVKHGENWEEMVEWRG